jgi:hypothetical protein
VSNMFYNISSSSLSDVMFYDIFSLTLAVYEVWILFSCVEVTFIMSKIMLSIIQYTIYNNLSVLSLLNVCMSCRMLLYVIIYFLGFFVLRVSVAYILHVFS